MSTPIAFAGGGNLAHALATRLSAFRPGDTRDSFQRTQRLFDQLAPSAGDHWDTLSMGMSDDFGDAIAQGATIVCLGTALFGPRPPRQGAALDRAERARAERARR